MYIMTPVLKSSSLTLKFRPVHFSENSCSLYTPALAPPTPSPSGIRKNALYSKKRKDKIMFITPKTFP